MSDSYLLPLNKLPISAIVVSLNEGHMLKSCLESIQFCDEIVVYDLGSEDNSFDVATQLATSARRIEREPAVEIIHTKYVKDLIHDWVLITDPDEVSSHDLGEDIKGLFEKGISTKTGAIRAPIRFYFKKILLKGTPWGGLNYRHYLVHRERFEFTPKVHTGRHLLAGYEFYELPFSKRNIIHHYWMNTYKQLINKHHRYLQNEGKSRYLDGQRISLTELLLKPFREFIFAFYKAQGYRDGLLGLLLSSFWAYYQMRASLELYKYQMKLSGI